ncbi:hypothetical protein DIZ81_13160 [Legionella taurinensis]|uniref:Tox-PL domain-containing protein n=1 Tax=Legionella taurinensis TaxID=70611 RepID=A0A3A5LE02_9GAMM|nr:hypothetical protein [Legionella taurinensis]MDX1836015.1 hypothetical protein [Legionella taurinensis]PUT38722.1 hypothetical protein DB744_13170 [Legionella taurinensis]PUT40101.1 hypothetical protein DB746_12570 [Legionella taurinensis]PUT42253.1 hypothetical protein DB743_13055 [Legionella taurinensis]PUT46025.1 hypothetical protein DB745_12025 [Legionella taurinensis]
MKDELLQKLKKINPIDVNGVPKNTGNCQWCAIEGARVLLEGAEPTEIPSYQDGHDPIEQFVHSRHGSDDIRSKDPTVFFEEIRKLKPGELMMVSLESEDIDHAYLIYRDDDDAYLIDPDRQVFIELDEREDFMQTVKGWGGVDQLNYLNGDVNSAFRDKVKLSVSVLTPASLERDPLPEYGTEAPSSTYRS